MKFLFLVIVVSLGITLEGCNKKIEKINVSSQLDISLELSKFNEIESSHDQNKKKEYFNRVLKLAENDDSSAQNLMGVIFENGYLNQSEDLEQAIFWYKKAIDNNNGVAENNMGSLYASGRGVEQNYKTAYEYYKGAMDKNVPEAINSIGFMYLNGFNFDRNLKESCKYFKKSADMGHYVGAANTANCYYEGWNGSPDKAKYFKGSRLAEPMC